MDSNKANWHGLRNELASQGLNWSNGGHGYENLSRAEVQQALATFQRYQNSGFNAVGYDSGAAVYYRGLESRVKEFEAEDMYNEGLQAQLDTYKAQAEAYQAMAEEASKPPEYYQDVNDVTGLAVANAQKQSSRDQALRRGLLSLTRFSPDEK